jgi:ABC-2 type transport system permease protein
MIRLRWRGGQPVDLGLRLYWEVGRRAYQRQVAYRTANLAGLVTNCGFGYLRAVIFLTVYQHRDQIAGYDLSEVVTFSWVTQALIMVVGLWGWWEVEETIRSGDVVSDLAKPFSYLGFWVARDFGRALYYLLFRCLPILLVGQLAFGLRWPRSPLTWAALATSVVLAVLVSFAWRFSLNAVAFWTADARGIGTFASIVVTLLTGLIVPLPYFPDAIRDVLLALPFASLLQTPADIFLERLSPAEAILALARQAVWAVVMLLAARSILAAASRRVSIQGG